MNHKRLPRKFAFNIALTVLLALTIPAANAEAEVPSAEAVVSVLNKYVSNGFEYSDNSLVIQPSLTVSYSGFSANLWANIDTDYYDTGGRKWNETDLTLFYDSTYEKLSYGGGWIYYDLEDGTADTQEVYVTLNYDVLLTPAFTCYYDIDGYAGAWYAELAFSHSFMIAEKFELDLGMKFGYLDDNEGYAEFHDGLLAASLPVQIGEYLVVTPELSWSFPLTGEASDLIKEGPSNNDTFVYGGVSVIFSM